MIELKQIDEKVEKVLEAQTLGRAQRIMRSRSGMWIIAMVSFVESALPLPILTDPFLAAGILMNRQKAAQIVLVTTIASVLGGLFAFASAVLFLDVMLRFVSEGIAQEFHRLVSNTNANIFVLTLIGAVTPIPYTLVAWVVAVLEGSLLTFTFVSIFGRGFRYAVVGYCTYHFGPAALRYARKYLGFTSLVILVLAILYVLYKM